MSSISCQDGARKADLSERYFNGSQQSLLRGWEGMGRDGKGDMKKLDEKSKKSCLTQKSCGAELVELE